MFKTYISISLSILIIISSAIFFFSYTTPTIKINNKTDDDLLVFFVISEKGVELNDEQIKQAQSFSKVPQGQSFNISISVFDYFLNNGRVNIGWRTGGSGKAVKRIGYNTLKIIPGSEYCDLDIDIYNDENQAGYKKNTFCIKSLQIIPNDN